jgi:hypothetical protein
MTENWLDNPYRTIIQFCEMKVVRGYTVIESLKELKGLNNSRNPAAQKLFDVATKFVKADKAYKIRNYLIQGAIIESMKKELK